MRRHFGLKATSVVEHAGSIRLPNADQAVAIPTAASLGLSTEQMTELKLTLPFAPASWRGCHGRRSISAE